MGGRRVRLPSPPSVSRLLDNVGASTSRNHIGLHACYREVNIGDIILTEMVKLDLGVTSNTRFILGLLHSVYCIYNRIEACIQMKWEGLADETEENDSKVRENLRKYYWITRPRSQKSNTGLTEHNAEIQINWIRRSSQ
jgi:hypothetical protein